MSPSISKTTVWDRPWVILFLVIILALVVRLVVLSRTPVISNDGFFYIYQAQKILAGKWQEVDKCRYNFVPFSTFSIIPFYLVVKDWVVAGQMSSIFWALAGIVPLYFLSKELFSSRGSLLLTLAYALHPFFVKRSLDVLKGPPYWFFSLAGFYLIVLFYKRGRFLFLPLASLAFLLAVSCRLEAVVYLGGSFLFLPFLSPQKSVRAVSKALFLYSLPLVAVLILFFLPLFPQQEGPASLYRLYFERRLGLAKPYYSNFSFWYQKFDTLARRTEAPLWKYLREMLWLLPLEILIYKIFSAFSALGPIFCLGLARVKARFKDPLVAYFVFISSLAFLLLLAWAYKFPAITKRYVIVFVLPAYVLIGLGFEWLLGLKRQHYQRVFAILLILLLIFPLVDIHKLRRKNKIPLLRAAQLINAREKGTQPVLIATTSWYILFYVNYFRKPAICYLPRINYRALTARPQALPQELRRRNFAYFVWEENTLGKRGPAVKAVADKNFKLLGEFLHSAKGKIIVYWIPQSRGQ
ncbi:hypothetical protein [Thermosulfuriphilus sp.]